MSLAQQAAQHRGKPYGDTGAVDMLPVAHHPAPATPDVAHRGATRGKQPAVQQGVVAARQQGRMRGVQFDQIGRCAGTDAGLREAQRLRGTMPA